MPCGARTHSRSLPVYLPLNKVYTDDPAGAQAWAEAPKGHVWCDEDIVGTDSGDCHTTPSMCLMFEDANWENLLSKFTVGKGQSV
jgi:hypothetical protein